MKYISRLFFYLFIFFLSLLLLAQINPVQTFVANKLLLALSEQTSHQISINGVRVTWLDRAQLHDLLILDTKRDTLIYAERITLNYRIRDLLNSDLLNIEDIDASSARLQLIKHDSISPLNLVAFIGSLRNPNKKSTKQLSIGEVSLEDFSFSMNDQTKETFTNRFDPAHMEMDFIDFKLSEVMVKGDSIEMLITQVSGEEKRSGFKVTELQSKLQLNNQSLGLTNLNLKTPTSQVSDSIKLYYNGLRNLSNFVDSVSFGFYLSNTVISQDDITRLIGKNGLKSSIKFDGVVWGTIPDFNMEKSKIGFGKESFIEGGMSCFGLPNLKGTFALADITDSHLIPEDIEVYVGAISRNVFQLGKVDFTGSFAGFLNDFVAQGDFITEKGSVHSDINLKIPANADDMSYSGNLELKNVDLGAFFDKRELIQKINLNGTIDGKGITAKNANFDLNAVMFNSGFKGYQYDTIRADGTFASQLFKGSFSVNDGNCKAKGYADLDFNREQEILKVDLKIDSVNLDSLNITEDAISIGGRLVVDVVDLDVDQFTGSARIDSAFLIANKKKINLDSIYFDAKLLDGRRLFELNFPGIEARLEGVFKITDAISDLSNLAKDYASKIKLSGDTIMWEETQSVYKMDFFAKVGDLSKYLDPLGIPLQVSSGSIFESTFRKSKDANLFFYAQADSIKIGNSLIRNPVLEVNGAKDLDSGGILTSFLFQSDQQEFLKVPGTKSLDVEGVWYNENIDLSTSLIQEETNSSLKLQTNAKLTADSILVRMEPSRITAFGEDWEFNPQNLITVFPDGIKVENLEVKDATESIKVEGTYSFEDATRIRLIVEKLRLKKADLFSDLRIDGLLDVQLNIFRNSLDQAFQFDGGFLASKMVLNDFLVGNIQGTSEWDPIGESVFSRIDVDRENFKSINLRGFYYPLQVGNQLDFNLTFDRADMRMAQPFLKEHTSNLQGFASGKMYISGSVAAPVAVGECSVSEGNVKINYLNTSYSFGGGVKFEPNMLKFDGFDLRDRKNAVAKVTGNISHTFFKEVQTNFKLAANNFEFLNTTAIDNGLYYGSANGSGTISVSGPLNDLLIKAAIKTEKGTRFFIPITEGGEVSQQEYIAFVDFSDDTKVTEEKTYKLSGLTLDFDIEVTPDAYCELIFDIRTGDIIRGRGKGNLKLTLDTDGEFHMFGPLEIVDGAYNFTVPGFINKEFKVGAGSQVTWFGDPYNANISLNAVYLQRASFEPLKSNESEGDGEFDETVGVNVILNLRGGMLAPEINFDLQIADKIDETILRQSKLNQIVKNEQELKRQVISLLFFKRFSPLSSFTLGGGGNVGNSVSEFFSNQVSYLVSQLDENLEVEVDFASLDRDAFNTFQLRLAYTFLDGRLKVTRGGDFQGEQGTSDGVLEDIVGDWSVEYSLTKDGRLRAKVFRSTNQQISSDSGFGYETGLSLRFVHSFNEFREILASRRREIIEQSKKETNDKSIAPSNPDSTY